MKRIQLNYGTIEYTDPGCTTRFNGGRYVNSVPHQEPHYYVIAHRSGYGDDILQYCREHDFSHMFIAQHLFSAPCPILYSLANGHSLDPVMAATYECLAQTFQAWLRANQEPIIGGINWHDMKKEALALLA